MARAARVRVRAARELVQTTDVASFAAAVTVLIIVVLAGTWIPARRASTTDPAIALEAD